MGAAVREQVKAVDKDQPLTLTTMDQIFSASVAGQRFNTLLLGIFASVALVLAMIGVFGVINYSVAQRTHEIGIRMALGAQRRDVFRMIVSQGLALTLVGVALGSAGAFALTRLITGLLYGVSPTDPTTFVACSDLTFSCRTAGLLHPSSTGDESRSVGGAEVRIRISDCGLRISNFVLGSVSCPS